jgi:hypothetical protein
MTYFITIKIERQIKICSLLESMAKEGERGKIQKIGAFKRLKLAWELPNDMGHGSSTRPLGLHTTMTQTPPTKYYIFFYNAKTRPLNILWSSMEFGPWAKCEPPLRSELRRNGFDFF